MDHWAGHQLAAGTELLVPVLRTVGGHRGRAIQPVPPRQCLPDRQTLPSHLVLSDRQALAARHRIGNRQALMSRKAPEGSRILAGLRVPVGRTIPGVSVPVTTAAGAILVRAVSEGTAPGVPSGPIPGSRPVQGGESIIIVVRPPAEQAAQGTGPPGRTVAPVVAVVRGGRIWRRTPRMRGQIRFVPPCVRRVFTTG